MKRKQVLKTIALIEQQLYCSWKDVDNISLYQGISGIALFYYNLYRLTKEEKHLNELNKIIETLFEKLNNSTYNYSYCEGLSGIAHLIYFLKQKKIIDEDVEDTLKEIDSILYNWAINYTSDIESIDFLHGSLGTLHYLIDRKYTKAKTLLYKIKEVIEKDIEEGKTSFETNVVNCGLAHGNISYLLIFSNYLEKYPKDTIIENFIFKVINLQLKYKSRNSNSLSVFPSIVYANTNEPNNYDIPMGWCYGDQTAVFGLNKAAKIIDDDKVLSLTKEIAYHCCKRDTIIKSFFSEESDACFCHGTSSAAYLFKKMYKTYNEDVFNDKYELFINYTLDRRKFPDVISGYKKYSNITGENEVSNSLLDGISGIGIVLIDYLLGNENNDWDKFFLLN